MSSEPANAPGTTDVTQSVDGAQLLTNMTMGAVIGPASALTKTVLSEATLKMGLRFPQLTATATEMIAAEVGLIAPVGSAAAAAANKAAATAHPMTSYGSVSQAVGGKSASIQLSKTRFGHTFTRHGEALPSF